jgi:hypothetical protein
MASVTRVRQRPRRRTVHEAKSAGDRPGNRTGRGVPCTQRPCHRRHVREQALKAFHAKGRALTGRTRGRTIRQLVADLRQRRRGWRACCGLAEVRAPRRALDPWIRRRLRSDHGKPWGRSGARELRPRGGGRPWAGNTGKSAHGPWRLRPSPARALARPPRACAALGLPSRFAG